MKTTALSAFAFSLLSGAAFGAVVFTESFSYPDGPLGSAAGSPWGNNTGTAGQLDVASGAASLTSTESEDLKAAAYGSFASGVATATFDVSFSALPSGATGAYFFHLVAGTNSFVARVWATLPAGQPPGTLRLAVSNSTNTFNVVPVDLALNTTYTLTLTYDIGTGTSSLAVGANAPVTATDAGGTSPLTSAGLRQAANYGSLQLDNLSIDVVPEPSTTLLGVLPLSGLLLRRRRR